MSKKQDEEQDVLVEEKNNEMSARLFVGVLIGASVIFFLFLTNISYLKPLFAVAMIAVVMLCTWEFCQLAKAKGYTPLVRLSLVLVGIFVALKYFQIEFSWSSNFYLAYFLFCAFICFVVFLVTPQDALVKSALTLFPLLYIALPLSYFIDIRFQLGSSSGEGCWWILYLLLVAKGNDMGGLFIGKMYGKTPLARSVSPNKTKEGSLGGFIVGILLSYILYIVGRSIGLSLSQMSWITPLWFAIVIGAVAQISDLIESLLKRDAGVKDSNKLPGLGGALDTLDSLIFTTPLLYFLAST